MRRATVRVRMVAIAAAATVALAAAAAVFAGLRPADSGVAAVPPPALAASAVPYLPSTVSVLSAKQLAADASIPALSGTLSRLGFAVGTQRVFQGPSKHRLQVVVSRTLRFRTAAGARGFVRFVSSHAGEYVGQIPTVRPLTTTRGRFGSLIIAPLCACHMAQPSLLAVASAGRDATWLAITGSSATPRALRALLVLAP